jgi:hypothetical protein
MAVALDVSTGAVATASVINTVAMAVAWAATFCACMESSSLYNDNIRAVRTGALNAVAIAVAVPLQQRLF